MMVLLRDFKLGLTSGNGCRQDQHSGEVERLSRKVDSLQAEIARLRKELERALTAPEVAAPTLPRTPAPHTPKTHQSGDVCRGLPLLYLIASPTFSSVVEKASAGDNLVPEDVRRLEVLLNLASSSEANALCEHVEALAEEKKRAELLERKIASMTEKFRHLLEERERDFLKTPPSSYKPTLKTRERIDRMSLGSNLPVPLYGVQNPEQIRTVCAKFSETRTQRMMHTFINSPCTPGTPDDKKLYSPLVDNRNLNVPATPNTHEKLQTHIETKGKGLVSHLQRLDSGHYGRRSSHHVFHDGDKVPVYARPPEELEVLEDKPPHPRRKLKAKVVPPNADVTNKSPLSKDADLISKVALFFERLTAVVLDTSTGDDDEGDGGLTESLTFIVEDPTLQHTEAAVALVDSIVTPLGIICYDSAALCCVPAAVRGAFSYGLIPDRTARKRIRMFNRLRGALDDIGQSMEAVFSHDSVPGGEEEQKRVRQLSQSLVAKFNFRHDDIPRDVVVSEEDSDSSDIDCDLSPSLSQYSGLDKENESLHSLKSRMLSSASPRTVSPRTPLSSRPVDCTSMTPITPC